MTLKYIFHLSDLHIRTGDIIQSRFNEYDHVFTNTIHSIKFNKEKLGLSFDDCIIVISGDIFHNKNIISNYGLLLYKNFIQSLTSISKVIIFHGNHDKNQNHINQPSLVFSTSFNIDNLIILNHISSFKIDNIGFSYISIDDTLDNFKKSGRIDDLPLFKKYDDSDIKIHIALFHGTFSKSKLFNGTDINDDDKPYPLEWIQHFDYAILGDIHLRQYNTYKNNLIYGYSGSLIQQNYGEDIIDHGYLIWDLFNKKIEEVNVYNDYGLINLKENENGILQIRKNGNYECFEDFINTNLNLFPKNIEIKLFSNINFHNLNSLLKKHNINFNIISNKVKFDNTDINDTTLDINDYIQSDVYDNNEINLIVDDSNILKYFNNILSDSNFKLFSDIISNKENLLFNLDNFPEELHDDCSKNNKLLSIAINDCIYSKDIKVIKHRFTIKYLEWEGLYCYENKSWINFTNLTSKSLLISGNNGEGKSALYDIITLSIWGVLPLSKQNTLSAGIINHNKKNSGGNTIIDIEIDNITYRITRNFKIRTGTNCIHCDNFNMYKFIDDNSIQLYKKDTAAKEEILKLFGTIENFLSSGMITQYVDCDILKMSYKETTDIIDKSCNIEYICKLYNLFKTALLKYKDFKRTIDNKKQVYEKLLNNVSIEKFDDDFINDKKRSLILLMKNKDELVSNFDKILVDIKNPKILIHLNIDYEQLLNNIKDTNNILDDKTYKLKIDRFNELKVLLKDKDIDKLRKLYNDDIIISENDKINKPCDINFINNEFNTLKEFLNIDFKIDNHLTIDNDYILCKNKYNELLLNDSELVKIQPNKFNKPIEDSIDDITNKILKLFDTFDEFENYIKNINKENIKPITSKLINFNEFNNLNILQSSILDKINKYKIDLDNLDNNINDLLFKLSNLNNKSEPSIQINLKTSNEISKKLKNYNIKKIKKEIIILSDKLIIYNKKQNDIKQLNDDLIIYKKELDIYTSNDEYQFNPHCEFCCKRKWVYRIKELDIIVNKIEYDINVINQFIIKEGFIDLHNKLDDLNKNLEFIDLLQNWSNYYSFKKEYDNINNTINFLINKKKEIHNNIIDLNNQFDNNKNILYFFNYYNHNLFDSYNHILGYHKYSNWLNLYNKNKELLDFNKQILTKYEFDINYIKNIKPRIDNYFKIKNDYDKWFIYQEKYDIFIAYEYYNLKIDIDTYDKFKEYKYFNDLKYLINQKLQIQDDIYKLDNEIKLITDIFIKNDTVNSYNNNNKMSYDKLIDVNTYIDNVINIMDTIINNFQAFRIDMYDKHVLSRLCNKINLIIKSLCHKDTKPFQLDYLLNVIKDVVHINWLIKNNFDDDNKQIISINQASGFQRFVISFALRSSLFNNPYEPSSNILFLDESFTMFDNNNLSIVPLFIKKLLKHFNTIVLVSHISLIKEIADESVVIIYDKNNNNSIIKFDKQIKTITIPNKKNK